RPPRTSHARQRSRRGEGVLLMRRAIADPGPARGARASARLAPLVCALLAASATVPAHAAPIVYQGAVVPRRDVETMFAAAAHTPADTAALARAAETLQRRLQSGGWLDARVHAAWDTAAAGALQIAVDEGARHRWTAPRIVSPSPAESLRIAAALDV